MSSDPRDYKLDLSTPLSQSEANHTSPQGRPYLSVNFACCGVYQRIYRSADGKSYAGRCPKCMRPVRFVVADGGTNARFFTVS